LRDVLTRLPKMLITQVGTITPEAWVKAQRQSAQSAQSTQSAAA